MPLSPPVSGLVAVEESIDAGGHRIMRIHTDELTADDIRNATPDGVWADIRHVFRSRSHHHGFDVTLHAMPGRDIDGKKRRKKNSGCYGAGEDFAATYDEHGRWMADLFDIDPAMRLDRYNGRNDFHRQTEAQYVGASV